MAFLFTHLYIANLVLKKLKNKQVISSSENIDDYFFGAIAPDIHYINNTNREITHKPYGEDSLFEALKISSLSFPFIAGYETHLIVDDTWSNDNGTMEESIYDHFGINVNDLVQKYSLYFLVDDYFQGEADSYFNISCAKNILRANDPSILLQLGFNQETILAYKAFSAGYLRDPGIDTFNVFNLLQSNIDEAIIKQIADQIPSLKFFLKKFKEIAVENCREQLEKYI